LVCFARMPHRSIPQFYIKNRYPVRLQVDLYWLHFEPKIRQSGGREIL
jgi:hypothetical protein